MRAMHNLLMNKGPLGGGGRLEMIKAEPIISITINGQIWLSVVHVVDDLIVLIICDSMKYNVMYTVPGTWAGWTQATASTQLSPP